MFEATIDNATARAAGEVVMLLLNLAVAKAARVLERARPLLAPPADLELTTKNGALYSGLLLVDGGQVIASLVMLSGQRPSVSASSAVEAPRALIADGRWSEPPERDDPPWRLD